MKDCYRDQISAAIDALKKKKTINHFYFVACGGSKAFLQVASYIFDKEIETPSSIYSANDFNYRSPKALNENSIVITCSHSGTTPETVEATRISRQKGALTIALSNQQDSPLWQAAEFPIQYEWGPEVDVSDLNKGILYGLIFSILNTLNPCEKYEHAIQAVDQLNTWTVNAKEKFAERTKTWAKELKRESLIYTMGNGANEGECYSFSICWMMEMQWINSSFIHSGEYFHGPFEITDFDVPFLIVKTLGNNRKLDDRAYNFCSKFSEKVYLVDAEELDLTGLDESLKEYFATPILAAVLRQLVEALAFERGHSLSVRRYMWQMKY
ncbi:SIS domain-containing protein [Sporolactobacillus nakayamae]|uniref:Fructosamine deglycase n=1 Tax=Sporolactobacillus nakayamae TaxID=269670 RepID=A0A1I2UPS0_9BACL|nr:SIS domain-containing protein [Sporolactobacillus nakayamae]SFG79122.1 fructoselysine 6-phosphate deglycase [Sporolactobacillus nakayamae]